MSDLNHIRQQIAEMRAETESWSARNRQMETDRHAKKREPQPTLTDLMQLMQQLLADITAIKTKLFS